MSTRGRTAMVAGAGLLVAALVGGVTYSLWSGSASARGATVVTGDLEVSASQGTWAQTTPGVTDPASGVLGEPATGFHTMPGDLIELRVPITVTADGDNLDVEMTVTLEGWSPGGEDLQAGYQVADEGDVLISEVTGVGEAVSVGGLGSGQANTTTELTVVVTVAVGGEYRWSTVPPLDDLEEWQSGRVMIDLAQVRIPAANNERSTS